MDYEVLKGRGLSMGSRLVQTVKPGRVLIVKEVSITKMILCSFSACL